MRYFDQALINANPSHHGAWWTTQSYQWDAFHANEVALAEAERPMSGNHLIANASAILPRDAWLEFDSITRRVMRQDDGRPYMTALMALAKPTNIGKIVHMTSVSSDISDDVVVTVSGQEPAPVDKVVYSYRGTPIPIFKKGYGREWREWNSLQSENFDALADDQEAATAKINHRNAKYVLDGDTTINVNGNIGYGIRNNPLSKSINLGSAVGGANIDLSSPSTTSDAIEAFINNVLGKLLDDNLVNRPVNLYVSPEIMRNLDRPYSLAAGFKPGSLRDHLLANRRIASIEQTYELVGNQFFGFVADAQYIRPIVGMATTTFAMPRTYPMANYQFLVWNAMGLEIRADYNGKSGVFYSVDVD